LSLLQQVRQRFSVQPRFIVALWGIESDFGKTMGNYAVVSALATSPSTDAAAPSSAAN